MTNSNEIFSAAALVDNAEARRWGIGFIDGSIPGYALLIGDDVVTAAALLADLNQRKILAFVTDASLCAKLQGNGQSLGWESGVVPFDLPTALGFIARVAQIFGGADETEDVLNYARQRLRGFALLLGEPTSELLAEAQSSLIVGCPLLITAELPLSEIVQLGVEERGLQVHVPMPGLPVAYSTDFSGQVVRGENCGACLTGVELTVTGQDVVDGRVNLIGSDLDVVTQGDQPFALLIEVSGRAMQPDFESVLERQIETILNDIDGVVHRGQRAIVTLSIHKKSIKNGLRLHHLGELLHARLRNEFGNIVSRIQINIYTEPAQVQIIRERAQAIYEKRDQRLINLNDEGTDTFYTCNLCQTIAAGHLCVISPEHPGTCGAVDWMDARAAVSIRPVGQNKAVKKEGLLDAKLGQWESVNQMVAQESGGARIAYSLYSLMQDPGSACGDFDCITAMLPLSNGVMVVGHDYDGMTPSGMDWSMLYEMVGAGVPVPGFMGHSKRALQREKFIAAEGGWRRIVWMNHALREELRPALETLAAAGGISGFVDMIATEQNALTEDEIAALLEAAGHPVLSMEPMI
jgi:acetyl-CoA synthase